MFTQLTKKRVNCFVAAAIVLTLGGGRRPSGLRKDCAEHY